MQVNRVVAIEQTIGHDFHLDFLFHWRQSSESLNKSGITVDLIVQATYKVVIRSSFPSEVVIFVRHLLQGKCQVKRHILLLCIKQDGEFVRL